MIELPPMTAFLISPQTLVTPGFIANPTEGGPWTNYTTNLNPNQWSSAVCAGQLAARYGAAAVPLRPYWPYIEGRVSFSPPSMWFLVWKQGQGPYKGITINAGVLADVWKRDPANADNECKANVDAFLIFPEETGVPA